MKRIFASFILCAFVCNAFAQGPADALLYSTNTYTGTARTMAMGNAFVALGGDIGAVSVNPASSAIYRHSEVSVTPALMNAGSNSSTMGNNSNDSFTGFKLTSAGAIFSFDTNRDKGLFNINFGLCVNRVADFNKISSGNWTSVSSSMLSPIARSLFGVPETQLDWTENFNPYSQTNLPWLSILSYNAFLVSQIYDGATEYVAATENITQQGYVVGGPLGQNYFTKSVGGVMEYAINLGFNLSDMFYLGVNFNIHSISYESNSYYSETANDSRMFQDGFVSMSSDYYLRTYGVGFNAEFGAIVTPVAGLRIGATITTPMIYRLNDRWDYNMKSSFDNGNNNNRNSPTGAFSYKLNVPLRWSLGIAYTFEDFALVSVDWESVNYANLSLANAAGNKADFQTENQRIANGFRNSSNIRAGLEIRPTSKISVRGGYNYFTSAGNLVDNVGTVTYTYPDTQYFSLGLGYRFGLDRAFSVDFAYQRMLDNREQYTAYSGAPQTSVSNFLNRYLLTFAYRF